jgi:hypothetical protein
MLDPTHDPKTHHPFLVNEDAELKFDAFSDAEKKSDEKEEEQQQQQEKGQGGGGRRRVATPQKRSDGRKRKV